MNHPHWNSNWMNDHLSSLSNSSDYWERCREEDRRREEQRKEEDRRREEQERRDKEMFNWITRR